MRWPDKGIHNLGSATFRDDTITTNVVNEIAVAAACGVMYVLEKVGCACAAFAMLSV